MKIVTPWEINESDILDHSVTLPSFWTNATTYTPYSSVVRQNGYDWVQSEDPLVTNLAVFDESDKNREFLFIGDNQGTADAPMLPPYKFRPNGRLRKFSFNSEEWEEQGTTNMMRAFDSVFGINQEYAANTYTEDDDGDIDWSIKLPGPTTAIAIMGVEADNVRVASYDVDFADGALTDIYNGALANLYTEYPASFYNNVEQGTLKQKDVFLLDLDLAVSKDIYIRVWSDDGSPVKVANVIIGYAHEFGRVLSGVKVSDASRSNTDFASDSFTFVPRAPGTVVDMDIVLPGNNTDTTEFARMQRLLRDYVNTACLYIPDESDNSMTVFGMHKTPFELTRAAPAFTTYSLTIESV